jgi:hypothetical protein
VCSLNIKLVGEIVAKSANEVALLLFDAELQMDFFYKQISLDSSGGNLEASMAIGRALRGSRMTVLIAKGAQCVSACVMILAGGVVRHQFGKIGIHRPYLNQPFGSSLQAADKLRNDYEQMLQTIRAYLRDMNVSERLAEDMLKIAPADIRYLSNDDLKNYGLTTYDPIEQETIDLQEAQSMGLDRREHVRRQALRKIKCGAIEDPNVDLLDHITCADRIMKLGR